jgi:hypothetical protein
MVMSAIPKISGVFFIIPIPGFCEVNGHKNAFAGLYTNPSSKKYATIPITEQTRALKKPYPGELENRHNKERNHKKEKNIMEDRVADGKKRTDW